MSGSGPGGVASGITLFNPLPETLHHYATELAQTLERLGVAATDVSPRPASDAEASHASRAAAHLRAVRRHASSSGVLVLWPSFGWLELPLWLTRRSRVGIIVHDPVPIRAQAGYDQASRRLSGVLAKGSGRLVPRVICHTEHAADAAKASVRNVRPLVCAHPVLTAPTTDEPVVTAGRRLLVAGQFKPTRDLGLLSALGPRLREIGFEPRIVGRGWPQIEGWSVRSEFVTETELDAEIRAAKVVMVPYTRYWQSGIAIRAVELNRHVVGEAHPFLTELLGHDSAGIVRPDGDEADWIAAVQAISGAPDSAAERRLVYRQRVDDSWSAVLRELWSA